MDKITPLPMADLLAEIDAFLISKGMTEREFGLSSVKDHKLIPDLRNGRELRQATAGRIRRFMTEMARAA